MSADAVEAIRFWLLFFAPALPYLVAQLRLGDWWHKEENVVCRNGHLNTFVRLSAALSEWWLFLFLLCSPGIILTLVLGTQKSESPGEMAARGFMIGSVIAFVWMFVNLKRLERKNKLPSEDIQSETEAQSL